MKRQKLRIILTFADVMLQRRQLLDESLGQYNSWIYIIMLWPHTHAHTHKELRKHTKKRPSDA